MQQPADDSLHLRAATPEETALIGTMLGRAARAGDVILLRGDLGAGKTTLTQAIARGLEVPDDLYVSSPSFALLHEYPGRIPLYHMDFYRLSGEDDIEGAGLVDYIGGPGLTVIEWPDRLGSLAPEKFLDFDIKSTGETERSFTLKARGAAWNGRLAELAAAAARFRQPGWGRQP